MTSDEDFLLSSILFSSTIKAKIKDNTNTSKLFVLIPIAVKIAKEIADCPLGTNFEFINLCLLDFELANTDITAITVNIIPTKAKCTGEFIIFLNILSPNLLRSVSLKNKKVRNYN